jgi:hypothetical protein
MRSQPHGFPVCFVHGLHTLAVLLLHSAATVPEELAGGVGFVTLWCLASFLVLTFSEHAQLSPHVLMLPHQAAMQLELWPPVLLSNAMSSCT